MRKKANYQIDLINGMSIKIFAYSYSDVIREYVRFFGPKQMYLIKTIHNIDLSINPDYYGN